MSAAAPPVVLLGGDAIAVSAARTLKARGVTVHALGVAGDPVRRSRACDVFVDAGPKSDVAARYLDLLESGPPEAVVLPCDDHSLEFIARHRAVLEGWGLRPIEADDDVVLAMLDKARTYDRAREVGIPSPRTFTITEEAGAAAAARDIGFPCAMKPLSGHRAALAGIHDKVIVVPDAAALDAQMRRCLEAEVPMLLTEIVQGGDERSCSFYSYLDERGEPLFHLTKRQIRQHPIGFGLTTYHETVWDPEIAELGLRFFQRIGLRGVGNVEFKRDTRDGQPRLIECNHRFTAANDLVRRAGIDIPLIAYSRLAGWPIPPITGYRTGVRQWHPIEDVRALRAYRSAGELTTGAWVRSLRHRNHFPMWRATDPGPTLVQLRKKVPRLARRVRS